MDSSRAGKGIEPGGASPGFAGEAPPGSTGRKPRRRRTPGECLALIELLAGLARRHAHAAQHPAVRARPALALPRVRSARSRHLRRVQVLSPQPAQGVRTRVRLRAGQEPLRPRTHCADAVAAQAGERMDARTRSQALGGLEAAQHGLHRAPQPARAPHLRVHAAPHARPDAPAAQPGQLDRPQPEDSPSKLPTSGRRVRPCGGLGPVGAGG